VVAVVRICYLPERQAGIADAPAAR
jgi:hypothetical protein